MVSATNEKNEQEEIVFIDEKNISKPVKIFGNFRVSSKSSIQTWKPDSIKQSYHEQRLSQSKWSFWLSFWGSILGFAVIIWCIWKSISVNNIEWAGIAAGTVIEGVSALFFYISNKANEKISEFFSELTIESNKKDAIELAKEVNDCMVKDQLFVKISLHLSGIDDDKICKNSKEVCEKVSNANN